MSRCRAVIRAGILLTLLGGCRPRPPALPDALSDTASRGPLAFTVTALPRQPQVGDVVRVDLALEAPPEYEIQLPQAQDFGELGATELAPPETRPGARGTVWRRSFALLPPLSGPLEIPALTAKYGRRENPTDSQPALENELVSNPLTLEVRSVLTAADKPEKPRDITGTLLPPRPPKPWWFWALVVAAVAGALVGVYAVYRVYRRWAARPAPPILPEVWALRALAELGTYPWVDQGRAREYYYRLTEIVRQYIERKFALAAPEMTTEEFLGALAGNRGALPYDAARLRDFLEACDYVKYAGLQPRREDAEGALATARAFVHATAAAVTPTPSGREVGEPR